MCNYTFPPNCQAQKLHIAVKMRCYKKIGVIFLYGGDVAEGRTSFSRDTIPGNQPFKGPADDGGAVGKTAF